MLTITRRSVLRGLGITPALLPFLPRGMAAAGPAPKRFILLYSPNGRPPGTWFPDAGGDITSKEITKPLAPFRDNMVMLKGIFNAASKEGPDNQHPRGMASWATGTIYRTGTSSWAGGPSVDQVIAKQIAAGSGRTPRSSIELGVTVEKPDFRGRCIYDAAGTVREPLGIRRRRRTRCSRASPGAAAPRRVVPRSARFRPARSTSWPTSRTASSPAS